PTRHPRATDDGNGCPGIADPDAAAEEELRRLIAAHREEARVLEEEGPLLREEEAESCEVELLLVHFDLGEIGIQRQVEREPLRHPDLCVPADFEGVVDAAEARGYALSRRQRIRRNRGDTARRHLQAR